MKTQLSLIFSFTLAAASVTWFSQDSINAYWQQTYHQTSPLEALAPYAEWTAGAKWQQVANEQLGSLKNWIATQNEQLPVNIAAAREAARLEAEARAAAQREAAQRQAEQARQAAAQAKQRQPEKLINGAAMACYQMGGCGCVNWFTHYLLRLLASCQRNIGEPPMRHFQAALSPAHCAHWLWRSFWSAVWMRHCSYCRSCCHALLLSSVLASPKLAAFVFRLPGASGAMPLGLRM